MTDMYVIPAEFNGCAKGFMELDVIRKRAAQRMSPANVLDGEFWINPDWRFTCNGNLTSLLLGANIPRLNHKDAGFPEIQIWRNTGGSNYTRQASQEIRLNPGDFSPDGVLQYNLTTPMPFQTGDVLGVY